MLPSRLQARAEEIIREEEILQWGDKFVSLHSKDLSLSYRKYFKDALKVRATA